MKEVRCLRKLLLIIALVLVPLIEIHADELNQSGFPLKTPIVCDTLKQANDTIPTEIKDTFKIDKISDSRFGRIVSYTAPPFCSWYGGWWARCSFPKSTQYLSATVS